MQTDREFEIDAMKYYFSLVRIKKQHGVGVAKAVSVFFVYYIYCTTLLMYGIVKKLFCMIKLYTYIFIIVDMNMMYVNCQLGNNKK